MKILTTLPAIITSIVVVTSGLVAVEKAHAAHHEAKKIVRQTHCPIMKKKKINTSQSFEYDGKKIYTCCKGCLKKVTKNPGKYVGQLEAAGITLYSAQTTCPISGKELKNKNFFVDHDGKRIYYCCSGCGKTLTENIDKYLKEIETAGIALDHAPKK